MVHKPIATPWTETQRTKGHTLSPFYINQKGNRVMKKQFVSFTLVFVLMFATLMPTTVYATSGTATYSGYAVDVTGDLATLLNQTKEALSGMGAAVINNADVVVGSALFAYLATEGITWSVEGSVQGAKNLGAFCRDHADELPDALARHFCGVVLSMQTDPKYYETKNTVITNNILNAIDGWFGNYVDAETITMNKGLVAQTVIPLELFNSMTTTMWQTYEGMTSVVYQKTGIATTPEAIYSFPNTVKYALVNNAGDRVNFYTESGSLASGNSTYLYYYLSGIGDGVADGWRQALFTSWQFTGDVLNAMDFGNMIVLQGDSFAEAIGLDVTIPMPLDKTGVLEIPNTLGQDLSIPYTDAIGVGTGEIALEDVAVLNPAGSATETGTLTGIWETIKTLPAKIGQAVKTGIEEIITPSEESFHKLKEKLYKTLPIIPFFMEWTGDLTYMLDNPEEYASNLTFTVDFDKAETFWDYGGSKTNMITLDWYFRYKDTIDEFIVGIAWLVFLWNLYGQIPNIINGVGTAVYLDTRNTHVINERAEKESYDNYKAKRQRNEEFAKRYYKEKKSKNSKKGGGS